GRTGSVNSPSTFTAPHNLGTTTRLGGANPFKSATSSAPRSGTTATNPKISANPDGLFCIPASSSLLDVQISLFHVQSCSTYLLPHPPTHRFPGIMTWRRTLARRHGRFTIHRFTHSPI